ncbi:hypothetical protein GGS21DRAFT_300789 [Xylaria nigripes]|nr:hypothetical protein GGS21DRAFT_300789 [Xylaria nigripes]
MFCTLKQNGLADQSYTFEATRPPFSKKREGRLAKIACTKCRISKLKCSGEPDGCQRCLTKNIDCRYPSPSRGVNGHKRARSQAQVPTPPETPQIQSPSRRPSILVDAAADDDLITPVSCHEMDYGNALGELDLGLSEYQVSDFATFEPMHGLLSDGEYMDPSDTITSWQQPMMYKSNSPWGGTPEREDVFYSADHNTSPILDSSCSCFSRAVGTYEAIEVAVWGHSELRTNPHNVLQDQKKAMIECELLLECGRCRTQSAYTMLLLSMCRRILTTLEELCRSSNLGVHPEAREPRRCGNDSAGEDEGRVRGYSINIQLDDDDERLVLQSLVAARLARFGRLLSELDKVVSEQGWPVHKGLIQDLQARLTGGSFEVGRVRRAWNE